MNEIEYIEYYPTIEDKNDILNKIKPYISTSREQEVYDFIYQTDKICAPLFSIMVIILESIFSDFYSNFCTNVSNDFFLNLLLSKYILEKYDYDKDVCIPTSSPMRLNIISLNKDYLITRKIIHSKNSQYIISKMDAFTYPMILYLLNTDINAKKNHRQPKNGKLVELDILDVLKFFFDFDFIINHYEFYSSICCYKIKNSYNRKDI